MASPGNQHRANCIGTLSFPKCTYAAHPNSVLVLISATKLESASMKVKENECKQSFLTRENEIITAYGNNFEQ